MLPQPMVRGNCNRVTSIAEPSTTAGSTHGPPRARGCSEVTIAVLRHLRRRPSDHAAWTKRGPQAILRCRHVLSVRIGDDDECGARDKKSGRHPRIRNTLGSDHPYSESSLAEHDRPVWGRSGRRAAPGNLPAAPQRPTLGAATPPPSPTRPLMLGFPGETSLSAGVFRLLT